MVNVLPPAYSGSEDIKIEIFTLAFRKVQDETFFNVPGGTAIPVELKDRWGKPLANGIYYVMVSMDGKRYVAKLLVLQ